MGKILRITARPEKGFRRCGIDHPPSPVNHRFDKFSAEAIEKLKAEPNLVVQVIDQEPAPASKPQTGARSGPAPKTGGKSADAKGSDVNGSDAKGDDAKSARGDKDGGSAAKE